MGLAIATALTMNVTGSGGDTPQAAEAAVTEP